MSRVTAPFGEEGNVLSLQEGLDAYLSEVLLCKLCDRLIVQEVLGDVNELDNQVTFTIASVPVPVTVGILKPYRVQQRIGACYVLGGVLKLVVPPG